MSAKTDMFCFQCEQTRDNTGCKTTGVCGKTPETAALQDLLVHALKGISFYETKARELGSADDELAHFVLDASFTTLTNVNFDPKRFDVMLREAENKFRSAKARYTSLAAAKKVPLAQLDEYFVPNFGGKSIEQLEDFAAQVGVLERQKKLGNADLFSLQELIMYGLKGLCAYTHHAMALGQKDTALLGEIVRLHSVLTEQPTMDKLLGAALKVGEANIRATELLEKGHVTLYGVPSPTECRMTPVKGKCILISGHDIKDVYDLLEQTKGTGINVYTHGELLPANAYPKLREHKHLIGNYGGPWQVQKFDFAAFPGPIVMTSNCLIEPLRSYKNRVFTRGPVGWPGVKHMNNSDFSEVIKCAQEEEGFTSDAKPEYVTIGYGKDTILSAADTVLGLIKSGALKDFFVIGGCDGSESERSYFRDIAEKSDRNSSVILTLGCGKFRFNRLNLGTIAGLPRVMDMGQCNDSYGAVQVALTLAKALNTDVNSLPIHYAISWFEQKAVAVFLTMLHLGIKNIYLGPNLPAFVTPNVLDFLVKNFQLHAANSKDPEADFKQMMRK